MIGAPKTQGIALDELFNRKKMRDTNGMLRTTTKTYRKTRTTVMASPAQQKATVKGDDDEGVSNPLSLILSRLLTVVIP